MRTVVVSWKASRIQLAAAASAWVCRAISGSATLIALPPSPVSTLARLTTDRVRQA
ncbi:hypothetical protein ACIBHX_35310 [Nonomuraea sp. NPDC050536]|uniref:hypothetical protein n=1 Tax=Nonomuraea sp. NPDC050536 TaxID=3364366 RepID=UPI0037CBFDF2